MKKIYIRFILCTAIITFSLKVNAKENVNSTGRFPVTNDQTEAVMSGCLPATDKADLDINNVRTTILTGGDMWWDLLNGKYFVPKPAKGAVGTTALFAGSLWIGGQDVGGSLKVAAMTYRQTGNDFWPGPLNDVTGDITASECAAWDKHYTINRADVEAYYYWAQTDRSTPNPVSKDVMEVIANWPTIGFNNRPLAPFWDLNSNGIYEYDEGEVPDFDITGTRGCNAQLFGDQSMFWVFNDKGNIHTETKGTAIGLEIQAQGFAFKTNDEINNMTFYRYKIINRSSSNLYNTYFGVWCDPDLGSGTDDYVGCDVELGLGFCYNGDLVDDNPFPGQIPYGANPPAIGIDFFEGPYADSNGVDDAATKVPSSFLNYGNGVVDDERIGMAKFVYYNNDFTNTGNPTGGNLPGATNIYNYLKGIWLDGSPITYGGNGYKTGVPCNYMFPGSSDPKGFGTNMVPQNPWDEASVGNVPADRRFIESAGPFTLKGGAVNTITIGVVWARTTQGGNLASVALMKGADSKAQKLFDRCFKTLDGPSAPILSIQEMENQLILSWTNPKGSNNYKEGYKEDPNNSSSADSAYRFEGYKIYQLKDATVSATDLFNVDKARLIFQCDINNNTSQIVNYTPDLNISALVPKEMVNGANKGIAHSLTVTDDKFAIGTTKLINHKTYYYAIIAYAYSPRPNTTPFNPAVLEAYEPYLAGRLSADRNAAFAHSGIPHIPSPEENGTNVQSGYGSGPKLIRIEGHGNGGNILDLTEHSTEQILANSEIINPNTNNSIALNPEYMNGRGPVQIKVVDPLNVADGNYRFLLSGDDANARWKLVNLTTNETVVSDSTIRVPNEQIINGQPSGDSKITIPKWGLSVNVANISFPGTTLAQNGGFLEATMTFADPTKKWLTGIPDQEGLTNFNWIRSGSVTFPGNDAVFGDYTGIDDLQSFEKILGGTWAPYRLCSNSGNATARGGPAWSSFQSASLLKNIASVDVVITSDKTKWTRCPVLELQEETALAVGNVAKLNLRSGVSVDKNGNPNFPSDDNNDFGTGMGWFPGYVINVETGERLNMAFGEDSFLKGDNGNDMVWNPTSSVLNPTSNSMYGEPIFGGKHYIYIFGHNGDVSYPGSDPYLPNRLKNAPRYDKGKVTHDLLEASVKAGAAGIRYKKDAFSDAMWVNIPMLIPNTKLLATDVKIRLRVAKPYRKGYAADTLSSDVATTPINNNYPAYEFTTSDLKTVKNDKEVAKTALDLINIVPNPYYSYSGYEKAAVDNIVKITNLPRECSINIYTLNGTLIRRFKKADESTSLDWDLKNQALIPIASGMYIIHINVPNVGEKVLKWFGVMRPIDLDAY
jgi:hypothetical protein